MEPLREALQDNSVLLQAFGVEFLSTQSGAVLVALIYHRFSMKNGKRTARLQIGYLSH